MFAGSGWNGGYFAPSIVEFENSLAFVQRFERGGEKVIRKESLDPIDYFLPRSIQFIIEVQVLYVKIVSSH